jgi:hypothetical protein
MIRKRTRWFQVIATLAAMLPAVYAQNSASVFEQHECELWEAQQGVNAVGWSLSARMVPAPEGKHGHYLLVELENISSKRQLLCYSSGFSMFDIQVTQNGVNVMTSDIARIGYAMAGNSNGRFFEPRQSFSSTLNLDEMFDISDASGCQITVRPKLRNQVPFVSRSGKSYMIPELGAPFTFTWPVQAAAPR